MPGHAAPEPHLRLPPGLAVRILDVSRAVYVHRRGAAVAAATRGEDGQAVSRIHVDGVFTAETYRAAAAVAAAAEAEEVELSDQPQPETRKVKKEEGRESEATTPAVWW